MTSRTSIIPPPTRGRAVLVFDRVRTVFFNREVIELTNGSGNAEHQHYWSVKRVKASAVTSHRVRADQYFKWAFRLIFYSRDGTEIVGQTTIQAPERWLPRTILVGIHISLGSNLSEVISVVDTSKGVDVMGLLRSTSGEAVVDTHDLYLNSGSDRFVLGGGDFNNIPESDTDHNSHAALSEDEDEDEDEE